MVPFDRQRLHQLHPAKLLVDWSTAIIAGALLWHGALVAALAIGLIPAVAVSALFLSGRMDRFLAPIAERPALRALADQLTAPINTLRLLGLLIAWGACLWHHPLWIAIGFLVILAAWTTAVTRAAQGSSRAE